MLKICRVLEKLRPDGEDLMEQLRGIERFARYCLTHLTEEEMVPVRKAVRMFLDHMEESAQ